MVEGQISLVKQMENVNVDLLYNELRLVRKKLEHLEDILIPEEEFSAEELKEIDKLRTAALEEHRKGQTISIKDL